MTGRGFRDESCSRGLSNSHSGRCLLSLRHSVSKKKKVLSNNDINNTPPQPPRLHLLPPPPHTQQLLSLLIKARCLEQHIP